MLTIAGCSTSPEGRTQLVLPGSMHSFSAIYSEIDMRMQLITATSDPACGEEECVANRAFDLKILTLGERLAGAAFRQYPDLTTRFPQFEIIVADKADPGAASSAAGAVVIYRGVQRLNLDESVLAFVLAREISQVIGSHHDENVTTNVLVSLAAQILMPFLNVARGAASAVASGTTATVASTAATTTVLVSAASLAGASAIRATYRPEQIREADIMAMKLLRTAGWESHQVFDQLQAFSPATKNEHAWTAELRESAQHIAGTSQDRITPQS